MLAKALSFEVDPAIGPVSALLLKPRGAKALYVLAHGAGAGMRHPFLEDVARALAARGIATLRYQFPSLEKGSKRPDGANVAEATVRAAVRQARRLAPKLKLFAGGKSFGGRMTSQAAAKEPLPGVEGLIFLGFPLHAPGRPGTERAAHLAGVTVPTLFVQGSRDEFGELGLMKRVVRKLGRGAALRVIDGGNHSFEVPKKSGRTRTDVLAELAAAVAEWVSHSG